MNRQVTRLVISFVVASLGASLLPLLDGGGGVPLIGVADRGNSLSVYAIFLFAFAGFLFPRLSAEDRAIPAYAAAMLAINLLLFATIPLLFCAYLSGVARDGLVALFALHALVFGFAVLLRRLLGPSRGAAVMTVLAVVLGFALPLSIAYLEALRGPLPGWRHWSIWHRLVALVDHAPPPAVWPVVTATLGCFAAAFVPSVRRRSKALPLALVLIVLLGAGVPPAAPHATQADALTAKLEFPHGLLAREGRRFPLRLRLEGLSDRTTPLVLDVGGDRQLAHADGQTRDYLFTATKAALELKVLREGALLKSFPFSLEFVPADLPLVAHLAAEGRPGAFEPDAELLQLARWLPFDPAALVAMPGALEAIDAWVLEPEWRAGHSIALQSAIDRHLALGAKVFLVDAFEDEGLPVGAGRLRRVRGESLGEALQGLLPLAPWTAIDSAARQVFTPPGWQEMDLSALVWFTVAHHLLFLGVFLVPVRLDQRKSLRVYLASVTFVVLLVTLISGRVLDRIFLAATQVYSHAVALAIADEGPVRTAALRQILCYASMSGESRDLQFDPGTDLVVIRGSSRELSPLVERSQSALFVRSVSLDRWRDRLMLRRDAVGVLPFAIEESEGQGFSVLPEPTAPSNPFHGAKVTDLFLIEEGVPAAAFARRHGIFRPLDRAPTGQILPREADIFFRRLVGQYHGRPTDRYLLVALTGVPRPDETSDFLWVRDLKTWVVWPLARRR